jgi:protein-S-isoprenylcysteine O-methyltransferase Ste14
MVEISQYNNWISVLINVVFFLFFVLSFLPNIKKRSWRPAGVYGAFIIALFTEMYGIPLTIYMLSAVFGATIGFSEAEGHLLANLLAKLGLWDLNTGVAAVMVLSSLIILLGLWLIIGGWQKIHKSKRLVVDGIYARVRHPQYLGILLITSAFLIQWPTLPTLAMWPILVVMYYRLAKAEEHEMEIEFADEYLEYKRRVPMFLPTLKLSDRGKS